MEKDTKKPDPKWFGDERHFRKEVINLLNKVLTKQSKIMKEFDELKAINLLLSQKLDVIRPVITDVLAPSIVGVVADVALIKRKLEEALANGVTAAAVQEVLDVATSSAEKMDGVSEAVTDAATKLSELDAQTPAESGNTGGPSIPANKDKSNVDRGKQTAR